MANRSRRVVSCRSSRTDAEVDIVRRRHAGARLEHRRGPPGEGLGQRPCTRAATGQETGQHRVTGADRAERRDHGGLAVDGALVVDEHGTIGAETRQHRPGAPVAQPARRFDDVGDGHQAHPGRLGELVAIRLDQRRAGGEDRLEGGPARVDDDGCPRIGQRSDEVGVDVCGRAGRQAAAGDEPVGRVDRPLDRVEHGVELVGAELGARLVDLGRRPVGFDDRDVRPDRSTDADRHDLDARVAQEGHEVLALGAAHGDDRSGREAVARQRPRDVDALAAGIDPTTHGPRHLAPGEGLDLDRPVDARVEGQGHDHASRTLGPSARSSSATWASSPESVISVSISSRAANRER